jgi:hypothetical protein
MLHHQVNDPSQRAHGPLSLRNAGHSKDASFRRDLCGQRRELLDPLWAPWRISMLAKGHVKQRMFNRQHEFGRVRVQDVIGKRAADTRERMRRSS